MSEIKSGDMIEHNLMPGFRMRVEAVEPCETPDHSQFKITDPEGQMDWLCERDVRKVSTR